jgi:hypothetical protein
MLKSVLRLGHSVLAFSIRKGKMKAKIYIGLLFMVLTMAIVTFVPGFAYAFTTNSEARISANSVTGLLAHTVILGPYGTTTLNYYLLTSDTPFYIDYQNNAWTIRNASGYGKKWFALNGASEWTLQVNTEISMSSGQTGFVGSIAYTTDTLTQNSVVIATPNWNDVPVVQELTELPLEFRYFMPGMYGQSVENALLIGNNLHEFQATWENEDDTLGYNVQIQYKGTYKVKKESLLSSFSNYETFTTEWHDIAEESMNVFHWWKDEVFIDFGKESPIYEDLKLQAGYSPSVNSMKQTSGTMRIRYLKYNDDDEVIGYSKWVSATINNEGATVVVTDDDGNPINTPEYGDGVDYTGEDLNPEALQDIASTDGLLNYMNTAFQSIGNWVGQVPALLGSLFTFLPAELMKIIGIGIAMVIILRVMGR